MDRTLQTLRALALITLLISVLTILYQLPIVTSAALFSQYYDTLYSPLNELTRVTSSTLGFATGIVALVVAAQRHHRGWFVWVLVPSLVTPYGPFLPSLAFSRVVLQTQDFRVILMLVVLSDMIPPIVTSLVVLAYTLRLRHPSTAPAVAGETDLEIEYTRLT